MKLSPADIAFSQCIRAAADHTCMRCGIQKLPTGRAGNNGLDCSHVYGRANRTVRWAKMNAKALCHTCHRWWHENPTESGQWFESKVGEGFMELLREKVNAKFKVPKAEEKLIAKHYREQLAIIEQKRAEGVQGYIEFESYQ